MNMIVELSRGDAIANYRRQVAKQNAPMTVEKYCEGAVQRLKLEISERPNFDVHGIYIPEEVNSEEHVQEILFWFRKNGFNVNAIRALVALPGEGYSELVITLPPMTVN